MNPVGNFNGFHLPLPISYINQDMNPNSGYYPRLNLRHKVECVECEKDFTSDAALREHYATHFPPLPSATPDRSSSRPETSQPSRIRQKGHQCEVCKKYFRQKAVLKTHMKIHEDVKDHHCPECGRGFTYKANMDVHRRIHSGEKPHKCCHCDKAFSQANTLKFHLSTHTGYKPYVCPSCQKAFITKGNLQDHMISHTKEKPYKCEICGDGFARKVSLRVHERLHTGEKPYGCKYCTSSYAAYSSLKYHQKKHCGPNSRDYLNKHNNSNNSMEDDVDFDFLLDNEVLDQVDTKPNSEKGDVLSCSNCDKSFRSRVTYIKHCQGCTGGNGSYSCNQCSAVFHEPVALDHHIQQHRLDTIASARLHAANKKHEMESSIAAMASSSLKSDHACGVCGHKFSSLIALQEHIPFHRFKLLNNHSSTIHGFS